MRFEGDLNQTLGALEGTAMRLNLMYDQGDRAGRSVADNRRWALAPALALGLGSETRAYFNYLFVKQINTPDGGLPPIGLDGYNYQSNIGAGTDPTEQQEQNVAGLNAAISAAVAAAPQVDRENFYGSLDDFEHVRANQVTITIEHDLSGFTTLRNTSRYGRQGLRRVITGINTLGNLYSGVADSGTATVNDADVWTVSRSRQRRDETNEVLTNQTNLTTSFATGAVGHSLSSGVEFIYERQLSRGSVNTGTAAAANLYNPAAADEFVTPVPSGAADDGKTLTAAAYLFDTLQFSEQWSVNAGLRYDHYRTEYSSTPAPAVPPAAPAAASYLETSGNLFTGKVGLVFKPLQNGSIYAAYATSQQPPGGANFTLNAGIPNANSGAVNINSPNLDPQQAVNIEVGTKWELLDNRLVVTAAAFDTRNKNDLATQDADTGEVIQYGERKVRGIELGAAGMITPNWQVSAGLASMDTEVVEGNANTTGAQIQYSPKLTFTSWTTYRLPFGLTIGGGARFIDSQYRNGNATQGTVTNLAINPRTWLIDAMASWDVSDQVSLQLNVQNLTDKFHFASVNNGGSRFILGTPRTILLSGKARFY
jgi:catecholate siderophore receptor